MEVFVVIDTTCEPDDAIRGVYTDLGEAVKRCDEVDEECGYEFEDNVRVQSFIVGSKE